MTLPEKPVVEILGTAVACRDNPEGFGIHDPVDECLSEAIAQARSLAIDEESVLAFPTPRPSLLELPAFPSSTKPLAPLIGGITLELPRTNGLLGQVESLTIPGLAWIALLLS